MAVRLARVALQHDVVLGQGLLGGALELVLEAVRGLGLLEDELGLLLADPGRRVGDRVVGRAARGHLEGLRARERAAALDVARELPVLVRRVLQGDLLHDGLAGGRPELDGRRDLGHRHGRVEGDRADVVHEARPGLRHDAGGVGAGLLGVEGQEQVVGRVEGVALLDVRELRLRGALDLAARRGDEDGVGGLEEGAVDDDGEVGARLVVDGLVGVVGRRRPAGHLLQGLPHEGLLRVRRDALRQEAQGPLERRVRRRELEELVDRRLAVGARLERELEALRLLRQADLRHDLHHKFPDVLVEEAHLALVDARRAGQDLDLELGVALLGDAQLLGDGVERLLQQLGGLLDRARAALLEPEVRGVDRDALLLLRHRPALLRRRPRRAVRLDALAGQRLDGEDALLLEGRRDGHVERLRLVARRLDAREAAGLVRLDAGLEPEHQGRRPQARPVAGLGEEGHAAADRRREARQQLDGVVALALGVDDDRRRLGAVPRLAPRVERDEVPGPVELDVVHDVPRGRVLQLDGLAERGAERRVELDRRLGDEVRQRQVEVQTKEDAPRAVEVGKVLGAERLDHVLVGAGLAQVAPEFHEGLGGHLLELALLVVVLRLEQRLQVGQRAAALHEVRRVRRHAPADRGAVPEGLAEGVVALAEARRRARAVPGVVAEPLEQHALAHGVDVRAAHFRVGLGLVGPAGLARRVVVVLALRGLGDEHAGEARESFRREALQREDADRLQEHGQPGLVRHRRVGLVPVRVARLLDRARRRRAGLLVSDENVVVSLQELLRPDLVEEAAPLDEEQQ